MMSRHFSERLYQRFGIYSDDSTEKKILIAISKKQAKYIRTDPTGVVFLTRALGPEMVIVFSKKGDLVTCDLPSKLRSKKHAMELH